MPDMKPILFNSDMVRAILAGQKTQTRRLIEFKATPDGERVRSTRSPYKEGDILYVRETWTEDGARYLYAADLSEAEAAGIVWKPSIHMPKEAARIFLRVTDVRQEKLQYISWNDCIAEGIPPCSNEDVCLENCETCLINSPRRRFRILWNSTIKKTDLRRVGWDANPWVWVIEFERVEREEFKKDDKEEN